MKEHETIKKQLNLLENFLQTQQKRSKILSEIEDRRNNDLNANESQINKRRIDAENILNVVVNCYNQVHQELKKVKLDSLLDTYNPMIQENVNDPEQRLYTSQDRINILTELLSKSIKKLQESQFKKIMLIKILIIISIIFIFLPGIYFIIKPSGKISSIKNVTNKREYNQNFTSKLGMQFIYISKCSFMMGSPLNESERYDNELQHQVKELNGFYIQTTEVTQGQWQAVMGNNPSHFKDCGSDCPVENISWNDVQEFINKLNQIDDNAKYRLPTETEWECACRSETQTPFSFGNCLTTNQENFDGTYPLSGCPNGEYRQKTLPVGKLFPNKWGLYDMHGNVAEWCDDLYKKSQSQNITDNNKNSRVIRGGSWRNSARRCRSANRYGGEVTGKGSHIGFRLVKIL